MKFTMEEYRMMLKAVNHEANSMCKKSEACMDAGAELSARYYYERCQKYQNLFSKMCKMMDDITE